MDIRFLVETVYKSLQKCQNICNSCPNKKLKDYIDQIGVDKFCELYKLKSLPEEIEYIFQERAKSIIL